MIIDGKKTAQELTSGLKKEYQRFENVILAAVVVGNDAATFSFLKQKQKIADELNVGLKEFNFPFDVPEEEIIKGIEALGGEDQIKGVIVQLPLPSRFNLARVLQAIPQEKDVDALGKNPVNFPPSVEVIKHLFEKYQIDCTKKNIVINGFGRLVGRPIYEWLLKTVAHSDISIIEKNTSQGEKAKLLSEADILISGTGKANIVSADSVKKGAILIDFGYDYVGDKLCGDIEKGAAGKARLFTPTPGGTGPILVAMIFKNLLSLLNFQYEKYEHKN